MGKDCLDFQIFLYLLPVKRNKVHKALWKQRLTYILVLVFCMLIAGVEYVPQTDAGKTELKKELSKESGSDHEAFFAPAVDAVVPFATVLGQQVFYLIYESISFDKAVAKISTVAVPLALPYWEILLERIISTNAP